MAWEPTVLSVSQITTYIRSLLEGDVHLGSVYICGEISNFTDHLRSGHWYFSLKDETSVLRAVMFRSANQRIRFRPENGLRVIVRGRITVYDRDGAYQLYAEDMQPDGAGALALAFEQLRRKLEAEGLFREERKRSLPVCPFTIGVITSPTGAARRDIESVLARRFPAAAILFAPVLVQGLGAQEQIVGALRRMNDDARAEVIILGRGGGSAEELWAFNEERVVRAVAASRIPVISAVGHETDYTLCDFAADCRAPTPSAAAELAVPDSSELAARISMLRARLISAAERRIYAVEREQQLLASRPVLTNPLRLLDAPQQRLDRCTDRLRQSTEQRLMQQHTVLQQLCGRLDALSPLRVLARGYAAVKTDHWVASAAQLKPQDSLTLWFHDGQADCTVQQIRPQEDVPHGEERNV